MTSRTVIAAVIPVSGFGDSGYVCFPEGPIGPLLVGNLNSFVVDWLARQRIGGNNLSLHVVQQLPLLPPSAYGERLPWAGVPVGDWVRRYVAELAVTSSALSNFGVALGWLGPPFRWDPGRRRRLTAELDALFLHLYKVARDDAVHILNSFWIVRERDEKEFGTYRTKDLVLSAYDAMAVATQARPFLSDLEPPPGDWRAAHLGRPDGDPGRWIPWSEVLSRPTAHPPEAPRRAARSRPPVMAMPSVVPENEVVRRKTELRPPIDLPAQQLLVAVTASDKTGHPWRPETAVEPRDIVMGMRVRHRSHGVGTVFSVKPSGKGAELLVRFDFGDEKWIVFGYGVLEFDGSP